MIQLSLFRSRPLWWTAADSRLVAAWHRLQAFLETMPMAPAHYVGEIGGKKERCRCDGCQDFERGYDLAEQAFDRFFAAHTPRCRTCVNWMSEDGQPAWCALLHRASLTENDGCEGWIPKEV